MPLSQLSTTDTATVTSNSDGGGSPAQAIGLGVGLGVGIPLLLAVVGGIGFLVWRSRGKDRLPKEEAATAGLSTSSSSLHGDKGFPGEVDHAQSRSPVLPPVACLPQMSADTSYYFGHGGGQPGDEVHNANPLAEMSNTPAERPMSELPA